MIHIQDIEISIHHKVLNAMLLPLPRVMPDIRITGIRRGMWWSTVYTRVCTEGYFILYFCSATGLYLSNIWNVRYICFLLWRGLNSKKSAQKPEVPVLRLPFLSLSSSLSSGCARLFHTLSQWVSWHDATHQGLSIASLACILLVCIACSADWGWI